MIDTPGPFRIFVAMPYTDMGANSPWNNPHEVKQLFYEGIQRKAAQELNRDVELVIEEDRQTPGTIHSFMFRECWVADAYIADITGRNPNVFLELGARWALRDGVTVLVGQDITDLPFNIASVTIVSYARDHDRLQNAIKTVVQEIVNGLRHDGVDNPVRESMRDVVTVMRREHDQLGVLRSQCASLSRELSEAYVVSGQFAQEPNAREAYFQRAISADALNSHAWVEYCAQLRIRGKYDDAIAKAQEGIAFLPRDAALHAQLGLAYAKQSLIDAAIAELTLASELDPTNSEIWSNLGGSLRRKAFESRGVGNFVISFAFKARDCYQKALDLTALDLSSKGIAKRAYALGNIARLAFVLSKFDPAETAAASDALHQLRDVCRDALRRKPEDGSNPEDYYYRQFDLADSYLLDTPDNQVAEGVRRYRESIASVPSDYRADIFASASEPLRQYVAIHLGDKELRAAMELILRELAIAVTPAS